MRQQQVRRSRACGAGPVWKGMMALLLSIFMAAVLVPASPAWAEEGASDAMWERLSGKDRYETMSAIVNKGFESSEWAVLATGANFPDALVASSVAGAFKAPIILTTSDELSEQASKLIADLGVKNIFIMGGEGAVSKDVADELMAKGINVGRINGNSRQATSIAALNTLGEFGKLSEMTVVIATGKNFADALSVGPLCYKHGMPILLVKDDGRLTDDQVSACKRLGVDGALIVGGKAVVSDDVWGQLGLREDYNGVRVAGKDRYETSSKIARYESLLGIGIKHVAIATGKNFPDALAGAALCGKNNSQLLLADDKDSVTLERIGTGTGIETGYVLGGEGAVSSDLLSYLESICQS